MSNNKKHWSYRFEKWLVQHILNMLQKRYIQKDKDGDIVIDEILINDRLNVEKMSLIMSLYAHHVDNRDHDEQENSHSNGDETDISSQYHDSDAYDNEELNRDEDGYYYQESVINYDDIGETSLVRDALFSLGDRVAHRIYQFRGVVYDADAHFSREEEWLNNIPEKIRPRKDQPFYHLIAENPENGELYLAYVSEQNLIKITKNDEDTQDWQALEDALQEISYVHQHTIVH